MRSRLDEYAAWNEIAMLCETCSLNDSGYLVIEDSSVESLDNATRCGLCSMLINDYQIEEDLLDRLLTNKPSGAVSEYEYWWPHDCDGWGARAEFAWRMAEQVAVEMEEE